MVKGARDRFGVRRLEKIDLWEISIVTFPMQPEARVIGDEGWPVRRDAGRRNANSSAGSRRTLGSRARRPAR